MGFIRIIIDFIKGLFGKGPKAPENEKERILVEKENKIKENIKKIDKELDVPVEDKDSLEDELNYWKFNKKE